MGFLFSVHFFFQNITNPVPNYKLASTPVQCLILHFSLVLQNSQSNDNYDQHIFKHFMLLFTIQLLPPRPEIVTKRNSKLLFTNFVLILNFDVLFIFMFS